MMDYCDRVMMVDGTQLHCNLNKTEAHMHGECSNGLLAFFLSTRNKVPESTGTICQQEENRTI